MLSLLMSLHPEFCLSFTALSSFMPILIRDDYAYLSRDCPYFFLAILYLYFHVVFCMATAISLSLGDDVSHELFPFYLDLWFLLCSRPGKEGKGKSRKGPPLYGPEQALFSSSLFRCVFLVNVFTSLPF
jgi:hypothetical protein